MLAFCNSDESLYYKIRTFGDFYSEIMNWCFQSKSMGFSFIHTLLSVSTSYINGLVLDMYLYSE
jgi:hypothetical protein